MSKSTSVRKFGISAVALAMLATVGFTPIASAADPVEENPATFSIVPKGINYQSDKLRPEKAERSQETIQKLSKYGFETKTNSTRCGTAPKLDERDKTRMIETWNAIRSMAGVPTLVGAPSNDARWRGAQEGAFSMSISGTISHGLDPAKDFKCRTPGGVEATGSSNIAAGHYGPADVLIDYMHDYGHPSVGHRLNMLNPAIKKTTFGVVNKVSTLGTLPGAADLDYSVPFKNPVFWPAPGYIPKNLMTSGWSISTKSGWDATGLKMNQPTSLKELSGNSFRTVAVNQKEAKPIDSQYMSSASSQVSHVRTEALRLPEKLNTDIVKTFLAKFPTNKGTFVYPVKVFENLKTFEAPKWHVGYKRAADNLKFHLRATPGTQVRAFVKRGAKGDWELLTKLGKEADQWLKVTTYSDRPDFNLDLNGYGLKAGDLVKLVAENDLGMHDRGIVLVQPREVVLVTSNWKGKSNFKDLAPKDLFYSEINEAKVNGITTGYPDKTFRPLANVERLAVMAFLYRMAGSPEVKLPNTSPFADVPRNSPWFKAIYWGYSNKITTGWVRNGKRYFEPRSPIARNAMAAFMFRFAKQFPNRVQPEMVTLPFLKTTPSRLKDISGDYFINQIRWLERAKITTGFADKGNTRTYRPLEPVHRDAMIAFLYRLQRNHLKDNKVVTIK
ncbi:hypothetical protein BK816_00395 [Boudabousia tangfeifanii]|uniref:SLH domain-containing protein n=1 Tax=Boudabousia tangfeifanii TaxID=1912795 RepID=A0A1D9MIB1_9ACTO|nr:S-layer homology domain-containing protein [Boudabousia tangfeifanii]AOZ71938.1 hypothetical protein BK816_00395 [Boudabousia tangfeifanii]